VGAYTLLCATWAGSQGRVFAFEPAEASRAGLQRHLDLNGLSARVTVRPEAVSDTDGMVAFLDAGTSGDNRIVSAPADGARHVPSTTIDTFCSQMKIAPDLIKIDIEGAELAALRGARRTIAARGEALALFVELHPGTWPSLGISRRDIEDELTSQRLAIEPPPGVVDPWTTQGICVRIRPA
jgi:FkbM family methyltransferase